MSDAHRAPWHRAVGELLGRLDAGFLADAECYFGGGTRIVLALDEYRISRDVDLMCASQAGYRKIIETLTSRSAGRILAQPVELVREIRIDRDAVRCRFRLGDDIVRFEIVREARIPLQGMTERAIPLKCLDRKSCFAEKFLANVDRWADEAASSRDLIDLAMMAQAWGMRTAKAGYRVAESAYGRQVANALGNASEKFLRDNTYVRDCFKTLAVREPDIVLAGIEALRLAFPTTAAR